MSFTDIKSETTGVTDDSTQTTNFSEITVGDRSFKSTDEVISKIQNADDHIAKLESEREEQDARLVKALEEVERLRQGNNTSAKVDELLDKLNDQGGTADTTDAASTFDPKQIVEQVMNELQVVESAKQQETNINSAMSAVQEQYGDGWQQHMLSTSAELGISLDDVDRLAGTSVEAFKKLFLKSDKRATSSVSSTNSSVLGRDSTTRESDKSASFRGMKTKERAEYIKKKMAALDL